jgi:hypothetical protein
VSAWENPFNFLELHPQRVLGIFFRIDYSELQILQEEGKQ